MRKTAISNTLFLRSAKDNGAYTCLYLLHTVSAAQHRPQAYLEPCKTSKVEHFTKTVTLIPFCSNILNAEVTQEVTRLSFLIKPYNERPSSNVSVSVFYGMKTKIKKKSFNLSRHGTLPTSDIRDLLKHAEKSKQKKSCKVN